MSNPSKLPPQIGVITYGGGLNVRAAVREEQAKGRIAVWRDNGVTLHSKS